MVHGLLERMLNATKIDQWFEAVSETQYTRKILFSSLVSLLLQVVCRVRSTVHAAYVDSDIDASRVAVYDKLKHVEPHTSREIVRYTALESEAIIRELKGGNPVLLPGYRVKLLDGNCIEATEHRLKVLRDTKAGALPGKSLVIFDPELDIALDVIPCEDGHAQERSLLSQVLATVERRDVWVADRNFCVLSFLMGLAQKGAFFVIRQHQQTPFKPLSDMVFIGESETGKVYEQDVLLRLDDTELVVRRILVKLHKPTRNRETELYVFTTLPRGDADAVQVADLYRDRWGIETAFQKLEKYLHSEINTLGYPKAALFGFCLALVAFNMYAVVMAAIRAAHPDKKVNDEVSDYYIAEEISRVYGGMTLIVSEQDWTIFTTGSVAEVSAALFYLASKMNLAKFKKHKRGPKKPPTPKNKFKGQPHVSTARLLANRS